MKLRFYFLFLAVFIGVFPWQLSSEERSDRVADAILCGCERSEEAVQNKKSMVIVLEAEFVQKSFIEIYLDGNRAARGFIHAGSHWRWEACESVQIKVGNAGGVRFRLNGKECSFGAIGQVANKVVTWEKDPDNPGLCRLSVRDW